MPWHTLWGEPGIGASEERTQKSTAWVFFAVIPVGRRESAVRRADTSLDAHVGSLSSRCFAARLVFAPRVGLGATP